MENNNKSQAEIYREERKERLAKAAAKKSKKSPKFTKAKKVAAKVIAIVLAVVVVLGAIGGVLNFFGAPQKVLKVSVPGHGDYSFSLAEFNMFYYDVWMQIENTAYQYEYQYSQYYGAGAGLQFTGYDYTKSPSSQSYDDKYSNFTGITLADLGTDTATWADVMKFAAVSQLLQTKYLANMAKDAGLSLTDEQKETVDKQIKDLAEQAKSDDYSTNRYLRLVFGNGITENLYREFLTNKVLAEAYIEKFSTDTENAITAEKINEMYNANPDNYNIINLRSYTFTANYDKDADDAVKAEARKKAQANAEIFLKNITDEASFINLAKAELAANKDTKDKDPDEVTALKNITKESINSSISEDAAKWAFSTERNVGDKAVYAVDDDNFAVLFITVAAHKDTTSSGNDVRHILIKFPSAEKDADGKEIPITDAQKAAVKEKAEKVLALYNENPTEENFVKLTKEYTEDVDSNGAPNSDGLYEGITASSNYVDGFLDWAIDDARKPKDVAIVETTFGYHIMYYVQSQGETWEATIKEEILSAASEDLVNQIDKDYVTKVKFDSPILNFAFKQETKHINQRVLQIAQNTASN